jgi:hypothetical protein
VLLKLATELTVYFNTNILPTINDPSTPTTKASPSLPD